MTNQNSTLAQQITQTLDKPTHENMIYYTHAEKLEMEYYNILARNNSLSETLSEIEHQWETEVELRRNLTKYNL